MIAQAIRLAFAIKQHILSPPLLEGFGHGFTQNVVELLGHQAVGVFRLQGA